MLINFIVLKKSRHPFLINLNNPGNLFHCVNIAFMSGLVFVPLPGVYHFVYLGLAIGHVGIRMSKYLAADFWRMVRKLRK